MIRGQQLFVWVLILVALISLVYLFQGILKPFIAGMAVAYFLDPLTDRLEKWGWSRTFSVLVILGMFMLFAGSFPVLLIPILTDQFMAFSDRLPDYIAILGQYVPTFIDDLRDKVNLQNLGNTIGSELGKTLKWVGSLIGNLLKGGVLVIDIFALLLITPLLAFYLLRDWNKIIDTVDSWLPRSSQNIIRKLAAEIDKTLAGWVRGQAVVCLILATFYGAGLSLIGLEFGLLVGIGTGLISFIPYVGMGIGLILSFGIALVQFSDWTFYALIALLYGVGQLIEGTFLTPKLVGDQIGLHPVWVIFALMAGGSLFGFTGVLLAIPIAAVIGVVVRYGVRSYMNSSFYLGEIQTGSEGPDRENA